VRSRGREEYYYSMICWKYSRLGLETLKVETFKVDQILKEDLRP
jgi:hypothetical protein